MIEGLLKGIEYFRIGFAYIGRVGSVAVTVSISVERYINCCFSNHDFAFKSLLVPFPIIFALVYNVPKFFESELKTTDEDPVQHHVDVTELRKNPTYAIWNSWSRFIVSGVLPFVLLVYFNYH